MIQRAQASQEVVEESSDKLKIAARMQQTFAASMEGHVKQREGVIKDVMQLAQECKTTMDDAVKSMTKVEPIRKRVIKLEERVVELEKERRKDKETLDAIKRFMAMDAPIVVNASPSHKAPRPDADRRVNQVRDPRQSRTFP